MQRKNTTLIKGRAKQRAPVRQMFTVALGSKQGGFCKPSVVLFYSLCSNHSPGLNPHQLQALLRAPGGKTSPQSKPILILKSLWSAKRDCENCPHFLTPSLDQALGWESQNWERAPVFKNFMLKGEKRNRLVLPLQIQPQAPLVLQNILGSVSLTPAQ